MQVAQRQTLLDVCSLRLHALLEHNPDIKWLTLLVNEAIKGAVSHDGLLKLKVNIFEVGPP